MSHTTWQDVTSAAPEWAITLGPLRVSIMEGYSYYDSSLWYYTVAPLQDRRALPGVKSREEAQSIALAEARSLLLSAFRALSNAMPPYPGCDARVTLLVEAAFLQDSDSPDTPNSPDDLGAALVGALTNEFDNGNLWDEENEGMQLSFASVRLVGGAAAHENDTVPA